MLLCWLYILPCNLMQAQKVAWAAGESVTPRPFSTGPGHLEGETPSKHLAGHSVIFTWNAPVVC